MPTVSLAGNASGDDAEETVRTAEMTDDADSAPAGAAMQSTWVAASRQDASQHTIEWRGKRGHRHRNRQLSPDVGAASP
ncbi:hypothetical protein EVC45_30895 [Paraburkholderia sp. UYCP14C]|nr:hypothetical protein EVC45_30895 [Paraburkholderia sp. UYCP14C]